MKKVHQLIESVSDTPIIEVIDSNFNSEGGNRVFIKDESNGPLNNHYGRVYPYMFKKLYENGKLRDNQPVLETGTGSACLAFAKTSQMLGHKATVIMPKLSSSEKVTALISKTGAEIIQIDGWVSEFVPAIKQFLSKNRDTYFLNHSMGQKDSTTGLYGVNNLAIDGISEIGKEIAEVLDTCNYFMPVIGNGTSILGPGNELKNVFPDVHIIGIEAFGNSLVYNQFYNDLEKKYGVVPCWINKGIRPENRGTSWKGFDFPHIRVSLDEGFLDGVQLVSSEEQEAQYFALTKRNSKLPVKETMKSYGFGPTTQMSLAGIKSFIEENRIMNKTFVLIGYDKQDLY